MANSAGVCHETTHAMNTTATRSEYLVISRGAWDPSFTAKDIQRATEQFYAWYDRLCAEGKMKRGSRLADDGKVLARSRAVIDGPFAEAKEVVGGFWFVLADSLEDAAEIVQGNPVLAFGFTNEIRRLCA